MNAIINTVMARLITTCHAAVGCIYDCSHSKSCNIAPPDRKIRLYLPDICQCDNTLLLIFFCYPDSFPDHRFHWTVFITVSTMQTVLLPDGKRCSLLNTFLWTMFHTCAASDTGFRYVISFFFYTNISQNICLPENWIYAKIKILHFRLINTENNSDFSCISRIYIRKIWLFFKNNIHPFFLFILCYCVSLSGQTNHFFVFGIGKNLNPAIFQFLKGSARKFSPTVCAPWKMMVSLFAQFTRKYHQKLSTVSANLDLL